MTIGCPLDLVFDYVADWHNLKSYFAQVIEIRPAGVVELGPGAAFTIKLSVADLELETEVEVVGFVRRSRIAFKSAKGLRAKGNLEFKPLGQSTTTITLTVDYELPQGFAPTPDAQAKLAREFDDTAAKALSVLKWILESQRAKLEAREG